MLKVLLVVLFWVVLFGFFFLVSECFPLCKMLCAYKMGHHSGMSAVVRTHRAAML